MAARCGRRRGAGRAGGGRRWWRRKKRGRAAEGERGMWKGRVRLREGHFCSECRSFPSPACLCPVRPCPRFRTQHHLISPLISLHLPTQSHIYSSTKKIEKQWSCMSTRKALTLRSTRPQLWYSQKLQVAQNSGYSHLGCSCSSASQPRHCTCGQHSQLTTVVLRLLPPLHL